MAYDKYEQKQIRKQFVSQVEHLGGVTMENNRLPRKLTIFIAPPPSDFLEESLKLFRRFVKPILNAAALDFEVFTETRQGDIRHKVAEDIRELRRLKVEKVVEIEEKEPSDLTIIPSPIFPGMQKKEQKPWGSISESLNLKKLLGVYYDNEDVQEIVRDDQLSDVPGGVICVGRGAFKEFITGVHEGLLGPLEALKVEDVDPDLKDDNVKVEGTGGAVGDGGAESGSEGSASLDQAAQSPESLTAPIPVSEPTKSLDSSEDSEDSEDEPKKPVPKPYISPEQYSGALLAPELDFSHPIKDQNNVAAYFQQPVIVLRSYNLVGFLRTAERIFRFYTKRDQATEYGNQILDLVLPQKYTQMQIKDLDLGLEEEADWPSNWVQKGLDKNSEWVQQLQGDDRVISKMRVYSDKDD